MKISLAFTRLFFFVLCVFFMTIYMTTIDTKESTFFHYLLGITVGVVLGLLLIGSDILFRRYNLRSFNIAVIGIFFGYLMGQGLLLILNAVITLSQLSFALEPHFLEMLKTAIFLFGVYLGTIMTIRASDELYISIPFVKFTPTAQKKKDILCDVSVFSDPRIIDFASSGLLNQHIIIPRFIIKDLYAQLESDDEQLKTRAKKSLETIKKLEEIFDLNIRYNDTDFPEVKDQLSKLIKLARLLDTYILSADISKVQMATVEGIKIINLHFLSNALKPLMQAGEKLKIKIQRYGKEPRQGIGYLDDGTMVVVNGGGDFIGDTIEVQVLSVKHTTSGRMVFCNAIDNMEEYSKEHEHHENENENHEDEEY